MSTVQKITHLWCFLKQNSKLEVKFYHPKKKKEKVLLWVRFYPYQKLELGYTRWTLNVSKVLLLGLIRDSNQTNQTKQKKKTIT